MIWSEMQEQIDFLRPVLQKPWYWFIPWHLHTWQRSRPRFLDSSIWIFFLYGLGQHMMSESVVQMCQPNCGRLPIKSQEVFSSTGDMEWHTAKQSNSIQGNWNICFKVYYKVPVSIRLWRGTCKSNRKSFKLTTSALYVLQRLTAAFSNRTSSSVQNRSNKTR